MLIFTIENDSETKSLPKSSSLSYVIILILSNIKFVSFYMLVSMVLSLILCLMLPNVYRSRALILPPQQDQNLMSALLVQMGGAASIASDMFGGVTQSDIYAGIMKSEVIKDAIIDKYNLIKVYDKEYRVETYKELDQNVNITVGKKDGIISVSVEDVDPKRSASIANSYIEELEKLLVKMTAKGASQNKAYLGEQLAKAKHDLAKSEDAYTKFQTVNKALDISEQAKGTIKGIADLIAQKMALEIQLATLQRQFTDSSQEVKNVKKSLDTLKETIKRQEAKGEFNAVPTVGAVPSIAQEYVALMRNVKIQEGLVELLTKQFELSSISEQKNIASIQVIQIAKEPDRKAKPPRLLILIGLTLASFMCMTFILMIYYKYFDCFEKLRIEIKTKLHSELSIFNKRKM